MLLILTGKPAPLPANIAQSLRSRDFRSGPKVTKGLNLWARRGCRAESFPYFHYIVPVKKDLWITGGDDGGGGVVR